MATDKKTKRKKNKRNTKKLWKMFDEEVSPNTQNLECLYRDSKISEKNYCDLCNDFGGKSKQSLSAHKRACKKKIDSMCADKKE